MQAGHSLHNVQAGTKRNQRLLPAAQKQQRLLQSTLDYSAIPLHRTQYVCPTLVPFVVDTRRAKRE